MPRLGCAGTVLASIQHHDSLAPPDAGFRILSIAVSLFVLFGCSAFHRQYHASKRGAEDVRSDMRHASIAVSAVFHSARYLLATGN